MGYHHNIEKSALRHQEYVGYAAGTIWHIRKTSGGWTASLRDGGSSFTRRTLAEVSQALDVTAEHIMQSQKSA